MNARKGSAPRLPDLKLALTSIAGFWALYLVTLLIRIFLLAESDVHVERRLLGVLVGATLTFLLYLVIRRAAGESLKVRIIVAAIAGLPAAAIFSTFNLAFFLYHPLAGERTGVDPSAPPPIGPLPEGLPEAASVAPPPWALQEILWLQAPRMIADGMVTWYFFFAAWASFYIAMSSAAQLRNAERRAAEFERQAQTAQLRALRYQVNPHFLFNTLNSLSSLVMARREEEAETMIVNLSTFFRSSLSVDPTEDITLAREIELQRLYLDIEKVRFPNRLIVATDVPDDLATARVPALLLQPLVENAIKHGVARSSNPVTLAIAARADGERLTLTVENDGGCAPGDGDREGTGVGIANVCERLAARYGKDAACDFGSLPGGGYRVTVSMPLVRHD